MSLLFAATNGHHFFNTRQYAVVTADNSATEIERVLIYAKNYPSINSPQAAYSLSLNYRNNQQWFASLSTCLFDRQWMGWNPIRRTAEAIYPVDQVSEKGQQLLLVERMPAVQLVNFFLSHNFRLSKKKLQQISCSISINNLLNKQDIVLAANEQLRFDFDNKDPNKFPPKYLHSMGRNFLLSVHYSF
jgi:aldehyde:ferredoxin oxidoreductase